MISKLNVTNEFNEVLELELRSPEKSGFLIRSVDGLDPSKANVNLVETATDDGGRYTFSRVNSKNIVFDLVLLPNYELSESVEDLRQKLYKYFPIKKQIKIEIFSDNRSSEIYGYIEANEVNIFSKEVFSQISVICPNPFFKKIEENIVNFNGEYPAFSFPFSNESLVAPLLELSEIQRTNLSNVIYEGDIETGMIFNIHAIGAAVDPAIYREATSEVLLINTSIIELLTGFGIIAGDDIIISTVKGNKYVLLFREGYYINILNSLDMTSSWLTLKRGDNILSFDATSGLDNLQISIEYYEVYEGV